MPSVVNPTDKLVLTDTTLELLVDQIRNEIQKLYSASNFKNVEYLASDEDGGSNKLIITLNDDSIREYPIKNGNAGADAKVTAEASIPTNDTVGTPSVSVDSSIGADNTTNLIFNFSHLKGNTGAQGPQGEQGPQGLQGPQGPQGEKGNTGSTGATGATGTRGSVWNIGKAMSGTSTTTGAYSYSGASNALVGDYYLNTTYGYVYRCTTAGSGTSAKWTYQGSIKGATGATGATGPKGDTGPQGPQGPSVISLSNDLKYEAVTS